MFNLNPRALLLIVGTMALLALAGYGWQRLVQRHNQRSIERPASQHAAQVALSAARRQDFDSVIAHLAGRTAEAHDRATITQAQYDSLHRLLPAALPELPAAPARYRRL